MHLYPDAAADTIAQQLNDACRRGSVVDSAALVADLAPIELLIVMISAGFVGVGIGASAGFRQERLRQCVVEACERKIDGWTWTNERALA